MFKKVLFAIGMLFVLAALVVACAPAATPTATEAPATVAPTVAAPTGVPATPTEDPAVAAQALFAPSAHANVDAEAFKHWNVADPKEVPTSCAKCHTAAGFQDFVADGKVDALDPYSGRLVWQRSMSYAEGQSEVERLIDINTTPIVKDNIAYLASYQGYLIALSLQNGEFLWRQKMSSFKDMALNKDTLYVVDDRSNVLAINRHTGMILWHQNALHDRKLNAPAISRHGLVLTDADGTMYVLSLVTGERLAQMPLEKAAQTDAVPIIDGKEVYVLYKHGLLTNYTLTS